MKLIIEDDDGRKTVVPFAQEEISIGREPGNTVRLTERNVSRRHAVIVREDDTILIEDLDSANGVRVNGDRIQGRATLNHGDLIRIGDYDLALDDESKPSLPERPTQPELTPVPDRVATRPREEDFPFHNDNQAVARFQKAAAIQALFAKGASPEGGGPVKAGGQEKGPWPEDFHFVAPGAVDRLKATEIRRRRIVLGAVIGSAAIFATVLAFGFSRSGTRAPGSADPNDAVVEPDAVPAAVIAAPAPVAPAPSLAAPAPSLVPPAPPPASPAKSAPPHSLVAPASPPESRPKSPRASTSEASRQKALNLYQDAFADVGNGDYSDALGKLQRSIELDPTSAAAQKEIAICYSHLRQPDKGVAHYEQYLKLRPDAPDAADVRKMISDYHASKETELVP